MSYKKLSELVHLVDIKNTDCKVTRVIGVSITKNFIPSVANLNGVDLTKYNLIKKNQFACKLMSVGRDLQLPIDLYKEDDLALISSAYYVFEVKDENEILPDYLNMWFRRKETDRWVGYISGGDVRGGISWDMFLEMDVNVPSIEKQREIVDQYQAVENKIKVNEQICEKLEATAQTLYKQWFVDFEFPNEEGKPYKSSGGAMVFNEELEKEIPEGWEVKSLGDLYKFQYGLGNNNPHNGGEYPVYGSNGIIGFFDKYNSEDAPIIGHIGANCGSLVFGYGKHYVTYNGVICKIKDELYKYYGYRTLQFLDLMSETRGSSQPFISYDILHSLKYFEIDKTIITDFSVKDSNIFEQHKNLLNQNQKLTQLRSLLLSRLATLEG